MARIVSRDEWLDARKALLVKEKELTRARDKLLTELRELPWVRVEKNYVFDAPHGETTLAELFGGRSQLVIQHFMFGPDWDAGCVGCSFGADHVDSARRHFEHNDLSFAAVSRAPIDKIEAYRKRMGWNFRWVSAFRNDFNYDFNVSFTKDQLANGKAFYNFDVIDNTMEELPGTSVFAMGPGGQVFHTYSAFGRGDEPLLGAYAYLDMTPKGRSENGPNFDLTDWVRRHDEYPSESQPQ